MILKPASRETSEEKLWNQIKSIIPEKKKNYFGLCHGCPFTDRCVYPAIDGGSWDCDEYEKFVEEDTKGKA